MTLANKPLSATYAECRYAECHYAERRGTIKTNNGLIGVGIQNTS
jgi:hypothetical protein